MVPVELSQAQQVNFLVIHPLLQMNKNFIAYNYSERPNTGPSGFRTVIVRTLLGPVFKWLAILFLPFKNRIENFLTSSLDHFKQKNILFMTFY
jgi:hypothetical protein